MLGKVTFQNVCQPVAPSVRADSSSSVPCSCIRGIISRATKGEVMKSVARMIPGVANTMRISCSPSHAPNHPELPNKSTKIRPAMTGETANGRSINVMRSPLPRNSNFAMSQAVATPKMVLRGTVMITTKRVSLIAASASGSLMDSKYTFHPLASASLKTTPKGRAKKTPRKRSVVPNKRGFSHFGSKRCSVCIFFSYKLFSRL